MEGSYFFEGSSGSGKTRLLRQLARNSRDPFAYIEARKCTVGVIQAILEELPPKFRDSGLIERAVYAGTIRLAIDGLNEASPSARAQIRRF